MNNMLSYCGLVDVRISASEKNLPVPVVSRDHSFQLYIMSHCFLQVKFGSHKRYQDWFQRQYLSTQESQSLRCDLIRFIVGVIHPTNELLCSDIIPRWAVIGWLLTTCTSQGTIHILRKHLYSENLNLTT